MSTPQVAKQVMRKMILTVLVNFMGKSVPGKRQIYHRYYDTNIPLPPVLLFGLPNSG